MTALATRTAAGPGRWPLRYQRGSHCASTMLSNAVLGTALEMPEELCFVIGSGHGFLYHREGDRHYVNSRMHDLELFFAQRTSVTLDITCHPDLESALRTARSWLEGGDLTYVYCEARDLPTFTGVVPWEDVNVYGEHVLPICEIAPDGSVTAHDYLWQDANRIGRDDLDRAMSMRTDGTLEMACPAHVYGVGRVVVPATAPPLAEIALVAIAENADVFLEPANRTQGVQGLKGLVTALRTMPDRFAPDVLVRETVSIFTTLEKVGSGGGAGRLLYGRGLAMVAELVGSGRLAAVAARYRDLGGRWRRVARTALNKALTDTLADGWSDLVAVVDALRTDEQETATELRRVVATVAPA